MASYIPNLQNSQCCKAKCRYSTQFAISTMKNGPKKKIRRLYAGVSALLFVHGINRYLPQFCVLLRVISEAEICIVFLECSNHSSGSAYDKPLDHEQLVVVLNQGVQNVAVIRGIRQSVPAKDNSHPSTPANNINNNNNFFLKSPLFYFTSPQEVKRILESSRLKR